jgi:hypothetical protein
VRLEIVWRNPIATQESGNLIRRIARIEDVAMYQVSNEETIGHFELLLGGAV